MHGLSPALLHPAAAQSRLRLVLPPPLPACRLAKERAAAGHSTQVAVTLVSRGPLMPNLAAYARTAFLPLLQARQAASALLLLCCCILPAPAA